ncbi:MAG: hypothetical protein AB7P52_15640 [Alphaproteobacteria bacterium]
MRRLVFAFAMIGLVALAGCNGGSPFSDTVTFRYKFAEQLQPDRYHVQVLRGALDPANCANQVEDIMRLDQIAVTVQRLGIDSLINICHDRFTVDVEAVRNIDPHYAMLEFYPLANTSERRLQLFVNLVATGNTFPVPSLLAVQTNGAAVVGVKTTDGFAEISFGSNGPTYRCDGQAGEDFWDEHIIDPATDTFFEFTLNSYDPNARRASAEFQCLARNTTDPSDNRLMLVMIGVAFMPTEN